MNDTESKHYSNWINDEELVEMIYDNRNCDTIPIIRNTRNTKYFCGEFISRCHLSLIVLLI